MLKVYQLPFFLFALCLISACKDAEQMDVSTSVSEQVAGTTGAKAGTQIVKDGIVITSGGTMGTYYNIRYVDAEPSVSAMTIDSILLAVNMELSTYILESTVSKVNSSEELVFKFKKEEYPHFVRNYRRSYKYGAMTSGRFDPTVAPLVNFWGFGYDKEAFAEKDTSLIPELMELVGFWKWQHHMEDDSTLVFRRPPGATLDFSGIAKGHGVDVVAEYFENKGIQNYFVDIGGEVKAGGEKAPSDPWLIGINVPDENSKVTDVLAYMPVTDFAVATSGNYRNFYVENGEKFTHIILPRSGYPAKSDMLSATVISKNCIDADAAATVFMVSGSKRSKMVLDYREEFEGFIVYLDENGEMQTWKSAKFPVELIYQ